MQNNYYFLRQLTDNLGSTLPGFIFTACYSQSKNELIMQFEKDQESFFIKALLRPDFSCLYFPDDTSRARKNSVDLFQEAKGLAVVEVEQFRNERSFLIRLEKQMALLFKMHGNRSNLILLQDQEPLALFNNKLVKDWNIKPDELHRSLDTGKDAFLAASGNYKKIYPTLGKGVDAYLREKGYGQMDREEQWSLLTQTVNHLENPEKFYLIELEEKPMLSLLPFGKQLSEFDSPVQAINRFFVAYTKEYTLQLEKQATLQQLAKSIKSSKNYLEKTSAKLHELQNSAKNRELADIIMANLYAIPPGTTEAELFDFYHDKTISIKLKKDLSPQKNAENYYRKGKNQQLEEQYLQDNIRRKEDRLLDLELHYEEIEKTDNLKDLRAYLKKDSLAEDLSDRQETLPYRSLDFEGFQIWVGKGATQNDTMLRYFAHKDDLWLHAKDVPGSHVLLKFQSGKNFPARVKERAASVAAWYSKRKSDSLCPVICTPRKWVRKRKGAAAGAVVVEKEEEVLLVQPVPFKEPQP